MTIFRSLGILPPPPLGHLRQRAPIYNKGQEAKNISELKELYSNLVVEVDALINSYIAKTPKGITPIIITSGDKDKTNCPKGDHLGFIFMIDRNIILDSDIFLKKVPDSL